MTTRDYENRVGRPHPSWGVAVQPPLPSATVRPVGLQHNGRAVHFARPRTVAAASPGFGWRISRCVPRMGEQGGTASRAAATGRNGHQRRLGRHPAGNTAPRPKPFFEEPSPSAGHGPSSLQWRRPQTKRRTEHGGIGRGAGARWRGLGLGLGADVDARGRCPIGPFALEDALEAPSAFPTHPPQPAIPSYFRT